MYAERGGQFAPSEHELMADILLKLVREIEQPVRRELAERLADSPQAPRELIVYLANDAVEVAHPVLMRSTALDDESLVGVVRERTMRHRLAVAMRADVSEIVSDALVEHGEEDVIRTLLENANARISTATMDYLVEQARTVDAYQQPILSRSDIGADQAKSLYWLVSAALRRRILEKFQIEPSELDAQLESAVDSLVKEDASRPAQEPAADKAAQVARRLAENNALTPTMMVQVLRQGEVTLFEAMFAELTGLRVGLVRKILYQEGGEGLAVAARSLLIEKPTFASLFLLSRRARPGDQTVDPLELSRALAFYDDLDVEQARRIVRRWRSDPQFLEAQLKLENTSFATAH